jgi:arginine deiminase
MTRRKSNSTTAYPKQPCTKSDTLGKAKKSGKNQCIRRSKTYHDEIIAVARAKQANVMHLDTTFPIFKPNMEISSTGVSKNIPTSHINNDTPKSTNAVCLPDTNRPCHDLL